MIATKEKFYTCKNDRAFKEIFLKEENKELLIKLLEVSLKTKIYKIKYENIERNTGNLNLKRKYFDVLLETDKGKIGIEMNARETPYLHVRNLAYQCDAYLHYVKKGKEYTDDIDILQLNLTYGMKPDENRELYSVYTVQNDKLKKYVNNFKIVEWDMDKLMEYWYHKDEEKIKEYMYLIMLDLDKEQLESIEHKDKVVTKFMKDLYEINDDPAFRLFLTEEEDQEMIHNTELKLARKEGEEHGQQLGEYQAKIDMAKKMLGKYSIEEIKNLTNLSEEEIGKLKGN